VDHTVGCQHVEGDDSSLAGGGLDVDVPVPGHIDVLAAGRLEGGCAVGNIPGLQGGSRDDMAEEHSGEGVLVGKQPSESVGRDLSKGVVGGGEDGEGSLTGEGLHEAGSAHGGEEGGELGCGDGKLGDGLGGGGGGLPGVAVAGGGGGGGGEGRQGQVGQGGLHGCAGRRAGGS